jgi:hypothetical protein
VPDPIAVLFAQQVQGGGVALLDQFSGVVLLGVVQEIFRIFFLRFSD